MKNPFEFPTHNPDFLTQSCTRCLRCNGDRVRAEQHALEGESGGIIGFADFWWCDDCGNQVPIGEGQKNEITGEIWWSQEYPRAADEGTMGVSHQEPAPARFEISVPNISVFQVEIASLDDFPPSIGEVLRQANEPPLRFQQRESALAGAVLVANELWGDTDEASQIIIAFDGEKLGMAEVVARLRKS